MGVKANPYRKVFNHLWTIRRNWQNARWLEKRYRKQTPEAIFGRTAIVSRNEAIVVVPVVVERIGIEVPTVVVPVSVDCAEHAEDCAMVPSVASKPNHDLPK